MPKNRLSSEGERREENVCKKRGLNPSLLPTEELVKELSLSFEISIPSVGEELINSDGVTIAEAELLWDDYKIALVLDESDLQIDGIKIFTLNTIDELKNELLERIV